MTLGLPGSAEARPLPAISTRFRPALLVAAGGGASAFLMMAHDARLRWGVPLGALAVGACAWGVVDFVRSLARLDEAVSARADARALALPALELVLACVSLGAALWGGAHGALPGVVAGVLSAAAVVGIAASLFALLATVGVFGGDRPLHRRHGFWLVALLAALDFPALGVGSLWDPWETHYGEVAREILSRDDWISTWIATNGEGFFYSKPVLGQWLQALAMGTLGVHVAPGRMLEGWHGALAHPEWAVRAPVALFAIGGAYALYAGVARACGRRAALLGAIALGTSPLWAMLSHQTMTDMPFVAPMCACVGLVLVGASLDDEARVRVFELRFGQRALRVSAWHAVVAAVVAIALPQILYLFSRNLDLVLHASGPHGFRAHLDEVVAGSAGGNCRLPGNPPCATHPPASRFEPWMQASVWTALLVAFVVSMMKERRAKRVAYVAAWLMAAIATMAKGPAGLGFPALAVLGWIAITGRWRELLRLEAVRGALVVAVLVLPWFVAMLVRHGSAFTDELIFHDMWNRALDHVHDTNEGADTSVRYYLAQLGYGLFPWTAFVPLGLFALARGKDARDPHGARALLAAWALVAFTLFSLMGTKFHHYVFPVVPPIAMLVGLGLDRAMTLSRLDRHARAMTAAAAVAGAALTAAVLRDLAVVPLGSDQPGPIRLLQLFTYRYNRGWPASLDVHAPILALGGLAIAAAVVFAVPRARRVAAWAFATVAVAWGAWLLDAYMPKLSWHWGQRALYEAYVQRRGSADEPIVAYQLNWKGESFYTGNRIAQFVSTGAPFTKWVDEERARGVRVVWVATEQGRAASAAREMNAKAAHDETTKADDNQFVLVRVEL